MKARYVYRLTSPSKKSYIGVAVDVSSRLGEHRRSKSLIGKALRRYGQETFRVEVLAEGPAEFCYWLEDILINLYNTLSPLGYNLASGGKGIREHHPETLKKMSRSLRLSHGTKSARAEKSAKAKLLWASESFREKVSQSNRQTWSQPEKLKAHSQRMRKIFQAPRFREMFRRRAGAQWKNPTSRKKILGAVRKSLALRRKRL